MVVPSKFRSNSPPFSDRSPPPPQPTNNADFIVPIDIEGKIHPVYVLKRPHVDEFLESVGKLYECVLFTASLAEVSRHCAGPQRLVWLFSVN